MEPRDLFDEPSGPLCSQVRGDNPRITNDREDISTLLRSNTSILGLVEEAGVESGAIGSIDFGVTSVIGGG